MQQARSAAPGALAAARHGKGGAAARVPPDRV
jgi:hypothetical protein